MPVNSIKLHTVNPLLSPPPPPPRGLFISSPFDGRGGGIIEMWGLFERRGTCNLEKMMVSVLYDELEYKAVKLMYKKVGGHTAEDQNQI